MHTISKGRVNDDIVLYRFIRLQFAVFYFLPAKMIDESKSCGRLSTSRFFFRFLHFSCFVFFSVKNGMNFYYESREAVWIIVFYRITHIAPITSTNLMPKGNNFDVLARDGSSARAYTVYIVHSLLSHYDWHFACLKHKLIRYCQLHDDAVKTIKTTGHSSNAVQFRE